MTADSTVGGIHVLEDNISNVQTLDSVYRIKKHASKRVDKTIVPSADNNVLNEPFTDNIRTLFEFSGGSGLASLIGNDCVDFFLRFIQS